MCSLSVSCGVSNFENHSSPTLGYHFDIVHISTGLAIAECFPSKRSTTQATLATELVVVLGVPARCMTQHQIEDVLVVLFEDRKHDTSGMLLRTRQGLTHGRHGARAHAQTRCKHELWRIQGVLRKSTSLALHFPNQARREFRQIRLRGRIVRLSPSESTLMSSAPLGACVRWPRASEACLAVLLFRIAKLGFTLFAKSCLHWILLGAREAAVLLGVATFAHVILFAALTELRRVCPARPCCWIHGLIAGGRQLRKRRLP